MTSALAFIHLSYTTLIILFPTPQRVKKYQWQGSSEHKGRGVGIDRQEVRELRRRLSDLLATSEEARWLDDGDFTLQCFLVSRNHDLAAAEDMFRGTVKWRTFRSRTPRRTEDAVEDGLLLTSLLL